MVYHEPRGIDSTVRIFRNGSRSIPRRFYDIAITLHFVANSIAKPNIPFVKFFFPFFPFFPFFFFPSLASSRKALPLNFNHHDRFKGKFRALLVLLYAGRGIVPSIFFVVIQHQGGMDCWLFERLWPELLNIVRLQLRAPGV